MNWEIPHILYFWRLKTGKELPKGLPRSYRRTRVHDLIDIEQQKERDEHHLDRFPHEDMYETKGKHRIVDRKFARIGDYVRLTFRGIYQVYRIEPFKATLNDPSMPDRYSIRDSLTTEKVYVKRGEEITWYAR